MRSLWVVLIIGLLVRVAALLLFGDNLNEDPDGYLALATQLLEKGRFALPYGRPTAFRPPLYPLLLAGLIPLDHPRVAIAFGHIVMGLVTAATTITLARRAGLKRAAPWAGLLVACDPLLVYQATLVMTETFAALLAVLLLLALDRMARSKQARQALGAGLLLGLSVLCRPTFLIAFPPAVVATALLPADWRTRAWRVGLLMLGTWLCLAPWTLRNWFYLGAPVYTTTHGGYTLWLANNPSYYDYLREPTHERPWSADVLNHQQQQMFEEARGREVDADRAAYRAAFTTIRQQPAMFLYSCAVRLGQFFSPLPNRLTPDESFARRLARYLVAVWYVAVYLLALVGIARLRRRLLRSPWLWAVVLCAAFALVHTFFWSNLRMRAPVMPVIALFAAAGLPRRTAAGASWVDERKE